jgi:hypothetical protein
VRGAGLSRAFSLLEVTPPSARELSTTTLDGVETPWGAASLAVDANGHRHVLIPMPAAARLRSDRRSVGVHIGPHVLFDGKARHSFLDLVCLKPELFDVFSTIAGDVLGALQEGPERPDDAAIGVLARWRALLARAGSEFPAITVLAGVWAELDHLLAICDGRPAALAAWRGPERAVHDFAQGALALEVKATLARAGWRCTVHGLDQLESPSEGTLYLSFSRLELVETGGVSVPEQLEALVGMGVDAADLYARAERAGLGANHLAEARKLRFGRVERRVWLVAESFPRLVSASLRDAVLPPGVVGVSYELDLTAHPSAGLDEVAVAALLKALAGPPA